MVIRFYESRGGDAVDRLLQLARSAEAAGQTTRLLASLDEPDLYLLTAEGPGVRAALSLPAGCRTWAFGTVEVDGDAAEGKRGAGAVMQDGS